MQFDVSFDQIDPMGAFHGVSKLVFDMPRDDWTFMHDRFPGLVAPEGIMAPCSANARLNINGAYYGLYVLEQGVGNGTVAAFFPSNPKGDLWKGGVQAETNTAQPNTARLKQFKSATDLTSLAAIVDIKGSLTSWGAEALLNDSDGYYGGSHNFYLYDQGAAGFVFLPQDTDSDLDWLGLFTCWSRTTTRSTGGTTRAPLAPTPGDKWLIVLGDAGARVQYADAIAGLLASGTWCRSRGGSTPGRSRYCRRHQRSARLGHPGRLPTAERPPEKRSQSERPICSPSSTARTETRRVHGRRRRRLQVVRRVRRRQPQRAPEHAGSVRQHARRQLRRLR